MAEPGFEPSNPAPQHTFLTAAPYCLRQAPPMFSGQTSRLQAFAYAAPLPGTCSLPPVQAAGPAPMSERSYHPSRKPSLMSYVKSNPSPGLPKPPGFPEHIVLSLLSCRTVCTSRSELLGARVRVQCSAWGCFQCSLS